MPIVCSAYTCVRGSKFIWLLLHPLISPAFLFARSIERFEADPIRLLFNVLLIITRDHILDSIDLANIHAYVHGLKSQLFDKYIMQRMPIGV